MMSAKTIWVAVFVSFMILILQGSCKDTVTTPESGSKPVIWVNVFQVSFVASESGADPTVQTLQVKNTGVGTLNYTIEDDANFYAVDWLSVDPPTGVSSGQIYEHKIIVQKTGMSARTNEYTAKITIKSVEAYNNPQQVDVSLKLIEQEPAEIKVSAAQLSFTGREGGSNPSSKSFIIENEGQAALNYVLSSDASWLSATPTTGSIPQGGSKTHNASVDISSLKVGSYTGSISVTDPNAKNNPQTISVNLTISQEAPPKIGVSPTSLSFSAEEGGSDPSPQNITISNQGSGTLNYQISWDAAWLDVSPDSGNTNGPGKSHVVSVNSSGLTEGTYGGSIVISDSNASNSPQSVDVTLSITPQQDIPDDNNIGLSISPTSGGNGTLVTATISITGNLEEISAFGLDLTFDSNMFQYVDYSAGSLTQNWGGLAANNPSSGVIKVGGWGGTNSIPVGSEGSVISIRLRVACSSCSNGTQSTIQMENLTDDIVGMSTSPSSRTFTYTE